MRKYRNIKSGKYDSRKERDRANNLNLMLKAGLIQNIKEQVKYELIPAQYINGKCVERACSYIADFVYLRDDELVVEDTKGFKTTDYIIKRKLMLFIHGIKINEL